MPIVPATTRIRDDKRNNVSVKCPIAGCDTYIPRNPSSWAGHMNYHHSADSGTWTDTGERGGGHGQVDIKGRKTKNLPFRWGSICYGCGATFDSAADLLTHLSNVHSAS